MNSLQAIKHITSVDGGLLLIKTMSCMKEQSYLDGMV